MQTSALLFGVTLIMGAWHANAEYKIGVGIADVTGPPAEVIFVSNFNFNNANTKFTFNIFCSRWVMRN